MNTQQRDELKASIRTLIAQGRFALNEVGCLYYDSDYQSCCIVGLWFRDFKKVDSDTLDHMTGSVYTAADQLLNFLPDSEPVPDELQGELSFLQHIHDKAARYAYRQRDFDRATLMTPQEMCLALQRGVARSLEEYEDQPQSLPRMQLAASLYSEVIQEYQ